MGCYSVNRMEGKVGKGGIDCVLVIYDHKGKGLGVHVSDDVLTTWLGGEGAWVLLRDSNGGRQWLCPSNFTGRGRGGVLLGDDILKEFGKGCFWRVVYLPVYVLLLLSLFSMLILLCFLIFFIIKCYLLCYIGQSFDFNFYFLNFYVLVWSISCLFVYIYQVYTLSY